MMAKRDHGVQVAKTLDSYFAPSEPAKRNKVFLVNVNLANVNLPTEPARRTFGSKLEALLNVMHDLQGLEGYVRRDRIYDTLVMMGVVDTEDEVIQLMRIAHRTGRIKEQGNNNGAWVTVDSA